MMLDELEIPVVLAPLAGGPSTPELAAAVSGCGGLGFVAAGYLSAREMDQRLSRARELTRAPIGVNLFVPGTGPTSPAAYADFAQRFRTWAVAEGVAVGEPAFTDDDWEAKLAVLCRDPPAVVSFTFGCPAPARIHELRQAGAEVWVSITSPQEARVAAQAGAQALVVQGAEAGGHRASFADRPEDPLFALLPLLALVRSEVGLALVASGAIATPQALAGVRAAGAAAAQVGTAFLLAPEAATSAPHREALRGAEATILTRAFTGRLARGIGNRFVAEFSDGAPLAYPELHQLTAAMRRDARASGDAGLVNLWAGQAYPLIREWPAAKLARWLAGDA